MDTFLKEMQLVEEIRELSELHRSLDSAKQKYVHLNKNCVFGEVCKIWSWERSILSIKIAV